MAMFVGFPLFYNMKSNASGVDMPYFSWFLYVLQSCKRPKPPTYKQTENRLDFCIFSFAIRYFLMISNNLCFSHRDRRQWVIKM